jgi:hypothetical protein
VQSARVTDVLTSIVLFGFEFLAGSPRTVANTCLMCSTQEPLKDFHEVPCWKLLLRRMAFSGMLRRVALVTTEIPWNIAPP